MVTDDECVGTAPAHHWYELIPQTRPWPELLRRTRRRMIYRAKRWLNRQAVMQMTAELLAQRDSAERCSSGSRSSPKWPRQNRKPIAAFVLRASWPSDLTD